MFQDLNPLDKPTAVAEILIMLFGAALFGFFISWLIQKFNSDRLKAEIRFLEGKYNDIQKKHAALEKDNREFLDNLTDLRNRKDSLLKELDDLKQDNEFIQAKFKNLSDTSHWTDKIELLESNIASLKAKNEELKIKLVEEHHTAGKVAALVAEIELLKSNKKSDLLNEKPSELNLIEEETNTYANNIEEEVYSNQEEKLGNEETIELEEILVTETNNVLPETISSAKTDVSTVLVPKQNNETYVFTKEEIKAMNQNLLLRVGTSMETKKNNLSKINGIGPLIEAKLNSIGIYTFEQISRFNDEDIDAVTHLIEFFPGRIERDNWVQQAKDLF
jgi:predicted flap endonuclease-1-like 5' DNA nuclease